MWGGHVRDDIEMSVEKLAMVVHADSGTGIMHKMTGVIAAHGGNITSIAIMQEREEGAYIFFEVQTSEPELIIRDLAQLPVVREVEQVKSMDRIYGKRIIIMGGGAQVGQVAIGAISEADRHNIRGEHISIDTIPLVGEQQLADAVRAVARLPRARALVLAGALMGGDIEVAVREVRLQRAAGDQFEYGGKRAGCRGSGGQRSRTSRCDGGNGGRGHRKIQS